MKRPGPYTVESFAVWPEHLMVAEIRSMTNPRVKQVVRLQREGSQRRRSGLFCVETARDLERALAAGFEPVELYRCAAMLKKRDTPLIEVQRRLDAEAVIDVTPAVLEKIAYRENPSGFVAVMKVRRTTLEQINFRGRGQPLVMVCSGLEKPGNVGAILRSADAAGVDAVMIDSPDFDLFNPNCIRASTGAVFGVPVVCEPVEVLIAMLRSKGVKIIAATPEAPLTYLGVRLKGSVALVVGSEDKGLSEPWRAAADLSVSIPMRSRSIDSLNVAACATLLLFEAMRQRVG